MDTGFFSGVKSGRGVSLTPHLLLVPLVMKVYSYTTTAPVDRTACTEPQCLYKGDIYLNLLKPTGYVMHHQFNIQQLYALPTLYLCVLFLSENKQRLVPLRA